MELWSWEEIMSNKKRILATLDCETSPFLFGRVPVPFVYGFYEKDKFSVFTKVSELIAYIKKRNYLIYAHNGGKFDFLFSEIFDQINAGSDMRIIDGRLGQCEIGESVLRDSFLIFPQGLGSYKKDEIDYRKLEEENRVKYWDEIISYLKSDCEYLFELIEVYHEEYGRKLTLASGALDQWKAISGLKTPSSNSNYFDRFYPYYFGGRVECFKTGIFKEKIKVYDINSAYPFAMLHSHPWGLSPVKQSKLPSRDIHLCLVTVRCKSKGYFPLRTKTGLSFPNDGEIRDFNITGWEFLAVLDVNPKFDMKVLYCWRWRESIQFTEYVTHFYNKKKSAVKGSASYNFAKLMLNSLYGKFAQNPRKHKKFTLIPASEVPAWEKNTEYKLHDYIRQSALMTMPVPEQAHQYFDLALACSITGFVRAYGGISALHRAERPFYMDTDGIHAKSLECELGEDIGQWNIEFTGDNGAYARKKLYALVDSEKYKIEKGKELGVKIASKGARLSSRQIFEVAKGETVIYRSDAPTMSVTGKVSFIERRIKMS